MQFGLFTSGYRNMDLETAFSDAAEMGYDYIELWGGRPHAFAPDLLAGEIGRVHELMARYKMPLRVYTPEHNAYPYNYMQGSERQFESAMQYLTDALRAAKALGAEYCLISIGHGGTQTPEQQMARLRRALRRLTETAEAIGQAMVLENLTPFESNCCTTLDAYAALMAEEDSPCLFAVCDVVVPFVQAENPAEYAARLAGRLRHLHLVDSDGRSDTHLIPGEGTMPIRDVIRDLRANGYDGMATIELVTQYIDDPSRASELAIRRLRQIYAAAKASDRARQMFDVTCQGLNEGV